MWKDSPKNGYSFFKKKPPRWIQYLKACNKIGVYSLNPELGVYKYGKHKED
jgi:hypothetical protein